MSRKGERSGIRSLMGEDVFIYLNIVVGADLHEKVTFEQGLERVVRVSQTYREDLRQLEHKCKSLRPLHFQCVLRARGHCGWRGGEWLEMRPEQS